MTKVAWKTRYIDLVELLREVYQCSGSPPAGPLRSLYLWALRESDRIYYGEGLESVPRSREELEVRGP